MQDLQDTELGRVYGEWKLLAGAPPDQDVKLKTQV